MLFILSNRHSDPGYRSSVIPSSKKIVIFGDSILRNLEDNLSHSELEVDVKVIFFPGATIQTLLKKIKCLDRDGGQYVTDCVVHIGTNNLESGIWERDGPYFLELFNTLSEIFRSANIIFSLILPRWDYETLHLKSVYYNEQIVRLSHKFEHCLLFDCSEDFLSSDFYYSSDGIHLTAEGVFLLKI